MRDARLNLLLTTPPCQRRRWGVWDGGKRGGQTVTQLLMPMGVRTFEADSGTAAMELMERNPIHMAVVDTRLPAIGGLNVLQLMQRLKEHGQRTILGGVGGGKGVENVIEKGEVPGVRLGGKEIEKGEVAGQKGGTKGMPRGGKGR